MEDCYGIGKMEDDDGSENDDDFDSGTRSADEDFHKWALDNEHVSGDIDTYWACEEAWDAALAFERSKSTPV